MRAYLVGVGVAIGVAGVLWNSWLVVVGGALLLVGILISDRRRAGLASAAAHRGQAANRRVLRVDPPLR